MSGMLKVVGWGPVRLPGEKRRERRALAEAERTMKIVQDVEKRSGSMGHYGSEMAGPTEAEKKAYAERMEKERSELREACVRLAAPLGWATDGTTASAINNITGYVRALEAEVNTLRQTARTAGKAVLDPEKRQDCWDLLDALIEVARDPGIKAYLPEMSVAEVGKALKKLAAREG